MPKILCILDLCSGQNSLSKALPNVPVLAVDIKPIYPLPPNTIIFKADVTKIIKKQIEFILEFCFIIWIWSSPECKDMGIIKNSVHTRDLKRATNIFYGVVRIKKWVCEIQGATPYFCENPISKISRKLWKSTFPVIYELSYCMYSEQVTTDKGYTYDTYPYRKYTHFGSNVEGLEFLKCNKKSTCKVIKKDGTHYCTITFPTNPTSAVHLLKKHQANGLFIGYNITKFTYRVPRLIFIYIHNGM